MERGPSSCMMSALPWSEMCCLAWRNLKHRSYFPYLYLNYLHVNCSGRLGNTDNFSLCWRHLVQKLTETLSKQKESKLFSTVIHAFSWRRAPAFQGFKQYFTCFTLCVFCLGEMIKSFFCWGKYLVWFSWVGKVSYVWITFQTHHNLGNLQECWVEFSVNWCHNNVQLCKVQFANMQEKSQKFCRYYAGLSPANTFG